MVLANQFIPPPGASSERAIQGRGKRILLKLIIRQRNKLICKLAYFILVFNTPHSIVTKTMDYAHPTLPDGCATSIYHPTPMQIFFGWLLCVK
jgi:hypothetical protein